MAGKRRRFSQEFKREAVRLAYSEGRSVSQVAEELDLRTDMLRRWRAELDGEPSATATATTTATETAGYTMESVHEIGAGPLTPSVAWP